MSGTNLLTSWEERQESWGDGHTVVSFSVGGDAHAQAILDAVVDRYNVLTNRPRPSEEDLIELIGEKVTIVQTGGNVMGAGLINAQEGKLFEGQGGLGILPKGARSKGFRVDPRKVLDVLPGYSTEEAAKLVRAARDHFPVVKPLTQERLNELPANSDTLSLCVFGTYPMPDTPAPGSIYLVSNYMSEDDIIEGVLLIRPEYGVSEHGSVWGRALARGRFGEVVGYDPISFAEGLRLCNMEFDEAHYMVTCWQTDTAATS